MKYVDAVMEIKKSNPDKDTLTLENKIDSLVYQYYGLSSEEIKLVEQTKKR